MFALTSNELKSRGLLTNFNKLFLLILTVQYALTLSFLGTEIRDLTRNDGCFKYEANQWTASKYNGNSLATTCSGTYLLGGYGILGSNSQYGEFFSRVYTGLPAHTMIFFTFTFWALDTWNVNNDYFSVQFDSTNYDSWKTFDQTTFPQRLCGRSNRDLPNVKVYGTVAHSASTLTFKIVSKMNENPWGESFGFRDLTLLFVANPVTTSQSFCGKATVPIGASECPCPDGQYKNGSTCTNCHTNCASCFGPNTNQCYACKTGYGFDGDNCIVCDSSCASCSGPNNNECGSCKSGYLLFGNTTCLPTSSCVSPLVQTGCGAYCDSPCSDSTKFIYWNGSCLSTCNLPLQQNTLLGSIKLCKYPCASSQYLYWDGSCQTTCIAPLQASTIANKLYCFFPCAVQTNFLYWNGTCSSVCNPFLVQRPQNSRNFCDFPCSGANPILYWNNTCLSVCNYPLIQRTEGGKSYCDFPCPASQFLYWNGTCSGACSIPLTQRIEAGGAQYCDYPCSPSQILYWNGSCLTKCNSPLVKRVEAGRQYCDYPCLISQFLYWNGTCSPSCIPPLAQRTEASRSYCDYPCQWSDQFLYWNGTCSNVCSTPLAQRIEANKRYCDYPCSTTQFLYWNGSCLSSCNFPLVYVAYSTLKYCTYPCNSNQFLYWNGTCANTCKYPLIPRIESNKRYCDYPCLTSEFLYWNGSCLSSCDPPLIHEIVGINNYCKFPCVTGTFLYKNGSCLDDCKMPYQPRSQNGKDYCDNICPDSFLLLFNGTCIPACNYPFHISTNRTGTFCVPPCDNPLDYYYQEIKECRSECNKVSLLYEGLYWVCFEPDTASITLVKLLHYVRYVDAQYPAKLRRIDVIRGNNVLSLRMSSAMFPSLRRWLTVLPLPALFEKRHLYSAFLANFIDDMFLLAILLAIGVALSAAEQISRMLDSPDLELIFKRLGILMRWNLPIIVFATNIGDILFYTSLEFRTYDPNYSGALLSLCICITMFLTVLVILFGGLALVHEAQNVKKEALATKSYVNYAKFVIKWENLQVLFRGYRDDTWFDQSFFIVYCFRLIFPMLFAAFLYKVPTLQVILTLINNTAMLFLLLFRRPIRKKIDYINLCLIETILLIINLSVLLLTVCNLSGGDKLKAKELLGDIIIYGNDAIHLLALAFLVAKIVQNIFQTLNIPSKETEYKRIAWVQLLFLPFQQGGFGFEQVQIWEFSINDKRTASIDQPKSPIKNHNTKALEFETEPIDIESISGHTSPMPLQYKKPQGEMTLRSDQKEDESYRTLPPLQNAADYVAIKKGRKLKKASAAISNKKLAESQNPLSSAVDEASDLFSTSKDYKKGDVSQFLEAYSGSKKNRYTQDNKELEKPDDQIRPKSLKMKGTLELMSNKSAPIGSKSENKS